MLAPDGDREAGILVFEQVLRQLQLWSCFAESEGLHSIMVKGVELNYFDVLAGMSKLPPLQKTAVVFMYVNDLPIEEVALAMKLSRTRVKREARSGLERLFDHHIAQEEASLPHNTTPTQFHQ